MRCPLLSLDLFVATHFECLRSMCCPCDLVSVTEALNAIFAFQTRGSTARFR